MQQPIILTRYGCLQAMVLVAGQMSNLADPVLNADPLFGVTGMLRSSCIIALLLQSCPHTNQCCSAESSTGLLIHAGLALGFASRCGLADICDTLLIFRSSC